VAVPEATEDRSGARAGTSGLIQIGGAFDYRAIVNLVAKGLPGGPPGRPGGELSDEEFEELEKLDEELEDELDDYEEEEEEEEEATYDFEDDSAEQAEIDPDAMYRATTKGADIVAIVFALRRWLEARPGGAHPDPNSDPRSGAAIVSLLCGWSATVTHALAAEPLTVDELERSIRIVDRETVEETLEAMERSGLVEALPGEGGRCELTEWGREGIAPLVASARYERLHPADYALPPDVLDVEAAFQMALPLVQLPAGLRGRCRLGVWIPGGGRTMAGATAEVQDGRVASSTTLLDESPETWITGLPLHWCEAVIDPSAVAKLKSGGDAELTGALLQALHERLFGETGA
jgi:DNA-binding HxlR family transcriptional regulator